MNKLFFLFFIILGQINNLKRDIINNELLTQELKIKKINNLEKLTFLLENKNHKSTKEKNNSSKSYKLTSSKIK